ncbi:hypothetical protein [Hyphomonas sp.]|uniref:hypothetical protein n=1 Tax=Hyphomonas sp. TaxID=87 RepID=UPI00391CF837
MQSDNPLTSTRQTEPQPAKDPDATTPGDGERVAPVEARSARRAGLWKMLFVSLALAIGGIALVGALSG